MFITLEGIEGSGKSSSLETINNYLSKSEISYINTREPGGSDLGKKLRSILLDTKSISPIFKLLCKGNRIIFFSISSVTLSF